MNGSLDHVGLTVGDLETMIAWYVDAFDLEVELAFALEHVDTAYDALLAVGATHRMAPSPSPEPAVRMAYVADPEGNLVELLDRTTAGATA